MNFLSSSSRLLIRILFQRKHICDLNVVRISRTSLALMYLRMYRKFSNVSLTEHVLRVRTIFHRFYSNHNEDVGSFLTNTNFSARHIGPSNEAVTSMLDSLGYEVCIQQFMMSMRGWWKFPMSPPIFQNVRHVFINHLSATHDRALKSRELIYFF